MNVITNSDEMLSDIINRAGGLKPNAYPESSFIIRGERTIQVDLKDIQKNYKSKFNIKVKPGDIIEVGSQKNIIQIMNCLFL